MKVTNPKCLCRNCKHQLGCKNHKASIRLQSLAFDLGTDDTTLIIKTIECKDFESY